jgi:hypothetical protein
MIQTQRHDATMKTPLKKNLYLEAFGPTALLKEAALNH